MRIEIFKAGRQTDSAGNAREWTEADLEKIASSYNPANHEAPVCIGHPKDNAPAWAWVKSVTREGSSLFAEIGDLVDEFSDMLSKKMFKKRSISLYPDLSLRHIGFLGAQPPAVKGLADFKFSEGVAPLEYADWETTWSLNGIGRLFQGLRDWVITSKDLATADSLLPQNDIDALKAMRPTPEPDDAPSYTEPSTEDKDMDKVAQLEAQVVTFTEKLGAETVRANAAEARAIAAEAKVAAMQNDKIKSELNAFADRMVTAGKMLPAQKASAIIVMESLSASAEMDFTEGEGASAKTVKKTPLKVYQETIEKGPQQIQFGEQFTAGVGSGEADLTGPASKKLTELTDKKVKKDKSLTFHEASAAVLKENPDLAQAYALELA